MDVHDADASESAVVGHEAAAAPHEGGVLGQIGNEAAARLATRHPDNDHAVATFHSALVGTTQRDDRYPSSRVAQSRDLAAYTRIRGEVREREVQDLHRHGAQL